MHYPSCSPVRLPSHITFLSISPPVAEEEKVNMVQLSAIPEKPKPKGETAGTLASDTEKQRHTQQQQTGKGKEKEKAHLQLEGFRDEFTTSVYGSRFAAEDLPKQQMPEERMPREVAYQLIKDDLSLDNNPILKYVYKSTGEYPGVGADAGKSQSGVVRYDLHGKLYCCPDERKREREREMG